VIELTGHRGLVVALAYSPDGRTLASASADGTARLWDLNTGKLTATLQSPAARAYCVAFSPDGKTLAVGYGGPNGLVQMWDIDPLTRRQFWEAHLRATRGVAFNQVNGFWQLATAGDGAGIRIWSFVSYGVPMGNHGKGRPAGALAWNRNGRYIADVTLRPAFIRVWETQSPSSSTNGIQPYRKTSRISDWGHSIAFHPTADQIVAGLDRTVAVWSPSDYGPPLMWPAHAGAVLGVAFTPDGETLLTGGADGLVKLWDPAGRLRHTFDWKIGDVGAVAFAPDGLTAAAGGYETILVWDVAE
jgi:WD40 repeat protein